MTDSPSANATNATANVFAREDLLHFFQSIELGDHRAVASALKKQPSLAKAGIDGMSPLRTAFISRASYAIVDILLQHGATLDEGGSRGGVRVAYSRSWDMLECGILHGCHVDVVDILFDWAGGQPTSASHVDDHDLARLQFLLRIAAEHWNEAVAERLGVKIIEVQRAQVDDSLCQMFTNALHSSEAQASVVLSDPVLRHWLSSTETSTTSPHVVDFRRGLLAGIRCRWDLVVEDMASLMPMVASEVVVVFPELLREGEYALVSEGSELRILAKEASGDAQDILRGSCCAQHWAGDKCRCALSG